MELRARALELLLIAEPWAKARRAREWSRDAAVAAVVDANAPLAEPTGVPGRPTRPRLVAPRELAARGAFTPGRRAALLHAVAHIEFNAINLALDAVWRFAGLPREYYLEWMQVASEEERTRDDPLARMALVPRTLEARGLDVTPAMRAKFARAGDERAARILDVILRDEIGHVAVGNRWYRWLCARDGLDPVAAYPELAARHRAPRPKPPFNMQARRAAGFDAAELETLEAAARAPR